MGLRGTAGAPFPFLMDSLRKLGWAGWRGERVFLDFFFYLPRVDRSGDLERFRCKSFSLRYSHCVYIYFYFVFVPSFNMQL